MQPEQDVPRRQTKGERTASRILDVAEELFARQGYDGTSLRQIADGAGIKEPGLYNHFSGKPALYEAVLFRALNPMATALAEHLDGAAGLRDYTDLPALMTDLLVDHPQMAALFHQALQGDTESVGNRMVSQWLEKLFDQGIKSLEDIGSGSEQDRATQAINLVAMFNLTTGYFLSQRAMDSLGGGKLEDPDNIARQKRLLHKVIRAMLIS
jgi:AcrR family transcriptional regulator